MIETATDLLFSVFPPAFGNKTSIALTVTKVDVSIKNINNKKTISVMDDILNVGSTLFLPFKFILKIQSSGFKIQSLKLGLETLNFEL